jgi:thiamine biosynthesis protein ThiS
MLRSRQRQEAMIRVNNKWDVAWEEGTTVKDVLKACGFTHQHLVVSLNGKLVPPGEYASQPVAEGAEVRVVHVIGGG